MRKLTLIALLLVAFSLNAVADTTTSRDGIILHDANSLSGDRVPQAILLIETTDSFIGQALTDLGHGYDLFSGADFSGVDLTAYTHVFVGMDGGLVEAPSIMNAAGWAMNGGCLHFFGGSCWQPFAQAMNDYLLENNVNDYCWSISAMPHSTVVDPGHYLANGLPVNHDFADPSASYYSLRSTDAGAAVAAVNGDDYDHLLSKSIGDGVFDICINSAYAPYWVDANDYDWGKQVVANMLECSGGIATDDQSWSNIKALYR